MENFRELSSIKQWGLLVLGAAVLTGAAYFTTFKSKAAENEAAKQVLDAKVRENAEL